VPADLRPAAESMFGDRLPLAERYADLLATAAVERGLIGPREAPRMWDRHLLNCAAMAELAPSGVYVVDVGSGAGLPGIVLAVARPDLRISLVESLARRTAFLTEAVESLGLTTVEIVRARAEECTGTLAPADIVTARAVAPLDRLAGWCLPLLRTGGAMLAIKGSSATEEIEAHRAAVRRLGGSDPVVIRCGVDRLAEPVTVVSVRREGDGRSGSGVARSGSARSEGGRVHGGQRKSHGKERGAGLAGSGRPVDETANAHDARRARGGPDRRSHWGGNDTARAAGAARPGDGGDHPAT
jgi:16S rRNA (guanine527-N7)-methyltransferase